MFARPSKLTLCAQTLLSSQDLQALLPVPFWVPIQTTLLQTPLTHVLGASSSDYFAFCLSTSLHDPASFPCKPSAHHHTSHSLQLLRPRVVAVSTSAPPCPPSLAIISPHIISLHTVFTPLPCHSVGTSHSCSVYIKTTHLLSLAPPIPVSRSPYVLSSKTHLSCCTLYTLVLNPIAPGTL